ncbi:MAG: SDR family NAD(P)-dependent oxidoreductase [Chloroflexi bacterium]|nr:MAG: SDR family NAD(P)-dependent oxidoreductase [Chloroflexota bacterium]
MIIETGKLTPQSLAGQVAVVTGAGRGIGFETARSLIWLGAQVVVAEIDEDTGKRAAESLTEEFGEGRAIFVRTDVGREDSIENLSQQVFAAFGKVDIVINNATITPMGAVKDVPISQWDESYKVNLRGPVLLARAFLPGILERDYGVFACVSSVGEAYMSAYESFKAAQVHLASALDSELEGTGVHAFTIGPGLARTPGLQMGVKILAPLYGKTVEEFIELSQAHEITVEAAGAGFAAAVVLAAQFRGQEISSKQALIAAGIDLEQEQRGMPGINPEARQAEQALELTRQVRQTLKEQSEGWAARSVFERAWMFRDFKKNAGMPVERWLQTLAELESALERQDMAALVKLNPPVAQLSGYYGHMADLAKGYEKNASKLEEHLKIVQGWQDDAERLAEILSGWR